MIFTETRISGAYVIDLEPHMDQRGFFARAWCQKEFVAHGLSPAVAQVNISSNLRKGTIRGMHYQAYPHREAKIVSCIKGGLYDVILDLRQESPTYLTWTWVNLSADNRSMVYIPEGCAHGFQTLIDNTDVLYLMSEFYAPQYACGFRYDDCTFGIEWPLPVASISDVDKSWPLFHANTIGQSSK
jgi:dTDP-4-dehydrorhamnose 3,5-epimerase